ncbi:swi5-dependent recombination DNA repair protein 1 homolog isoform X2 [Phyllobates terribilis]|uniref:swi5-dependent recombination DNA repair protein 1 homolog isoform X2 n=1 Tax=Phyllobates terribilis TaxID=111132 RepID=UPI003CCAE271
MSGTLPVGRSSLNPKLPSRTDVQEPMSASLRERLKKCRRSFNPTCTVAKRLKVDGDDSAVTPQCSSGSSLSKVSENNSTCVLIPGPSGISEDRALMEASPSKPDISPCNNHQEMLREKKRLQKRVQDKEERLRRLKMVKLYRSKNNLMELQSLIDKWRESSQLLLYEIQRALSAENKQIGLTQLIDNCGLDEKLLRYNRAEEDFDA